MNSTAAGPGLAKTKRPPLVTQRTVRLMASSDSRWRELFENANVVSEGAPTGENSERTYFGSTNIILPVHPERPGETLDHLTSIAARDPHVRVRALRVARREAEQRASGPLAPLRAEISVSCSTGGVAVHVDVAAHVFPDRRALPRFAIGAPTDGA